VDPIEYLSALKRRWLVIAVTVVVGLTAAWFTSSGATNTEAAVHPTQRYEATALILNTGSGSAGYGIGNLNTIAAITTIPDVESRVAKEIGFTGDPQALGAGVIAHGDATTGLLSISTTATDPDRAALLANTFAEQLIGFLGDRQSEGIAAALQGVQKRIKEFQTEIAALDRQIENNAGQAPLISAKRDSDVRQLSVLYDQYGQLASAAGQPTGLQILQDAVPTLIPNQSSGFQPPKSRTSRLLIALVIGLILGVALALVVERFDNRIRTKVEAEQHFAMPVLAEIPVLKRKDRRNGVVVSSNPASVPANAFRLLGASMRQNGKAQRRPQTILVTSAGPGEGKSTVVANLASTFAERGDRVLILSCDFRHPTIHRLLGVPNEGGLSTALASSNGGPVLNGAVRQSLSHARVRLVPSGPVPAQPGELLSSDAMRRALFEARAEADIVLVETGPILTASEAVPLLNQVDAVLVVARSGKTTVRVADRTGELLRRLEAPVTGIALNAVSEPPVPLSHWYEKGRYYRDKG
jgi:capsular exopolysaccharide synthesis family protein